MTSILQHQSWLPFIHTPSATEPPAYTPPPLKKGWAPLGMLWIALACFVKEDQLPSLAEATVMLHSGGWLGVMVCILWLTLILCKTSRVVAAFVPSVLHSALPPPPSEIFNPWRNVSPKGSQLFHKNQQCICNIPCFHSKLIRLFS